MMERKISEEELKKMNNERYDFFVSEFANLEKETIDSQIYELLEEFQLCSNKKIQKACADFIKKYNVYAKIKNKFDVSTKSLMTETKLDKFGNIIEDWTNTNIKFFEFLDKSKK